MVNQKNQFENNIIIIYMLYHEKLLNIYLFFFQFCVYLTYILIILYIIGAYKGDPTEYLKKVDNYAKIIISLFLMWKFNFLRSKIKFTEIDRRIVFQSGLFLFLTTSIDAYLINYFDKIKNNKSNNNSNK